MIRQVLLLGGVVAFAPAAFAQTAPDSPPPDPNVPPPDMRSEPVPVPAPPPASADQCCPPTATTSEQQISQEPSYVMRDRQYQTTTTETRPAWMDIGFTLTVGGGVSGFTNDDARDATDDGGAWDVRAGIGTKYPLGLEVAYIGSAQSIDAIGLDNDAILVGNGAQANLRVNIGNEAVKPFLFGGAAWRHYSLTNEDFNTSAVGDSDNVYEFPVGAGVSYRYRGFYLDARGEFRPTIDNDLFPEFQGEVLAGNDDAELHRWGVNATVGAEF